MPQTLKEILSENKLLFAGVVIPYFLAAGLMIGTEKGLISTPNVYARKLYHSIAGKPYKVYIAIGKQIPVPGISPGLGEGDKIQFTGRSIEVQVINSAKSEALVSVNDTSPLLLKLGETKHTQNGGVMTLLDISTQNQEHYIDLAVSDMYEMRTGDVINDFFCPREIKLLSASDSKAVVKVGNEELIELKIGERLPTSEGTILNLLKIEK